jgi:type I restriction enzyme S subunit
MTFEWGFEKLGDLTINLDAKRKPVKEVDRKRGPHPYYGASGIVDYVDGYLFEGEHLLIAEDGENLRTRQTPIAFRADGKFWVNNHAHIVVGNHRASTRYLEYAVLGTDISAYLTGAVMPKLTQGNLNRIEVPCPPIETQNSIVAVLGSLDDRITLLRETNTTLEAIAQALFKSWFVDFDPVRAKSEGVLPEGIDEATAALFPDAFEETELGMVPKGWQASTLSSLATFQNGYAFKGSDWVEQGHPVIKIGNVKPLLIDFEGCSYVSPETVSVLDRFKLNRGDLLVGMTGYVGETGLVTSTEVASYLNQRVGRIVTSQGLDDLGFLFAAVRQAEFKAYAESQSHGSAQANVSGADLMKFTVVIPSAQVLNTFNQLVGKLIEQILANFEEAKTLTNLRDTLLPRLISGKLRVADDELDLEKVTA